jgi:DNA-binding MarR family transcriptional regulator
VASENPVKEIMDSVRRIVQALRSSHRAAGGMKLTGAQLFVIATLGDANGPLSVGELARRTRTDQSTVSVVVSRLVEKELVRRGTSSEDNRRVDLSLTPKGKALQKRAPVTVPQQRLAEALERLSARDAATLSRLLSAIVADMGESDQPAHMLFEEPARKRSKKGSR